MGRPVVWFGTIGEAANLIKSCACSITVPTGDAADLAQALRDLNDDHTSYGARLRPWRTKRKLFGVYDFEGATRWQHGSNDRPLSAPVAMTFVIHIASLFAAPVASNRWMVLS
jgi:hypothetical protein